MTSTNSLGSTQVTLEFELSRNLDGAAVDVQAAITQAARLLPTGMPTPPTFTKVNPADQPILYLALTSSTLPLWTLDEYAEIRVAQRISMISGVAQVQVLGAQKYAVHVQMDPHAMAARQVGINEVETALQNWNVNLPTGTINGPQRAFTLQATRSVDERGRIQVARRRLSQGLAGSSGRTRQGDRQRGGRQDRVVVLHAQRQRARGRAGHPAPARNQHHRSHRCHQAPAADLPLGAAAVGQDGDPVRPLRHHPRVLSRCAIHHGADPGPDRHGDLPFPAQCLGDHHPQPGAAVFHHRHVRGDVPASLQPRQSYR